MIRRRRPGLRMRTALAFGAGATVVAMVLAAATLLLVRQYLTDQRRQSATRQAYADASVLRDRLLTAGTSPTQAVGDIAPREGTYVLLQVGEDWYSSALAPAAQDLPDSLVTLVEQGKPGYSWTVAGGERAIVLGTPLPAANARMFEISSVEELQDTLSVFRTVLALVATTCAAGAALLGWAVAGRVVKPLDRVAEAATAIAGGRTTTRLPPTSDPELVGIVGSFNAMVDALASRIERESRFTADVSHELRTPLTALTTAVHALRGQRQHLPERAHQVLDVIDTELQRLRTIVADLLELARMDAGTAPVDLTVTRTDELLRFTLVEAGRSVDLLHLDGCETGGPVEVLVDRRSVARAVGNLLDNADRHGGGCTGVLLRTTPLTSEVVVEDRGPGVPEGERDRIFERFARAEGTGRATPGSGLGLSLVVETAARHGGTVWYEENPSGGARFVIALPRSGPYGPDRAVGSAREREAEGEPAAVSGPAPDPDTDPDPGQEK